MRKMELRLTLAAIACTLIISTLNAAITSAVNNNSNAGIGPYVISSADMATGELVHIDRTTQFFSTLPPGMTGLDYVLTANDDKTATALSLDLTFDTQTKLYLSLDNRIGNGAASTPPALGSSTATQWVIDQGWTQTTQTWDKIGDPGNFYTVYTLICFTNQFTLYGQNGGNMYSIAAEPYTNSITHYASIDIGPDNQRVEPGWRELPDAPTSYNNNTNYGPTTVLSKTLDAISVSLDEVDWRDRGNASNVTDLVLVGEDFVKDNTGQVILTLDNLRKGHYTATTYHIDSSTNQSPRIQVYVSDCVSNERLQPTYGDSDITLGDVNMLTTQIITDSKAEFEFWADGTNSITLRFQGTPGISSELGNFETPLNGIDLILDTTFYPPKLVPFALIDIGPITQRLATNSIALPNTKPGESGNQNYGPETLTAEDSSNFTLTIDSLNTNGVKTGGIDWRDRGDSTSTNESAKVAEDFIKNNGGLIRVKLEGVKAGSYRIESYHIDSSNQQCENTLVYISDALRTAELQELSGDSDFTKTDINSLSDQKILATASTFEITANGSDEIILYFDGTAAVDTEVPLNGLLIEKIIDTSLPPVYPKGTVLMLR